MQWADVGIRERSTCTQLNRVSGRSGAVSVGGHEAGSPIQVFVSPDDDRRAGACAPLTPGVRQPVAASRIPVTQATVSHRVERSTTSGTSGRTHQTRNRFRLRRITVR
jgi:hypothetical protein